MVPLSEQKTWLITGVAGFIGSHLLHELLRQNQRVFGIDNFLTGSQCNLDEVRKQMPDRWKQFQFIEADITVPGVFKELIPQVDVVLHQAALGSVPRSIERPLDTHHHNVNGFINLMDALKSKPSVRLVYATSSSVYGDHPTLPKVEETLGSPQSPYAASKLMNEIYARTFANVYGLKSIGLRYFNVFGPRQDPEGPYAAVIPKWVQALLQQKTVQINGDGETSRDFCFVENAVQANLLAATTQNPEALNQVYNIAFGERTTLNQLYGYLRQSLQSQNAKLSEQAPRYSEFRAGDIRHSLASIEKARKLLQYRPEFDVQKGIQRSMQWYVEKYN